jgi:hypothetical protein
MGAKRNTIEKYYPDDELYGPSVLWTLFGDPALRVKYPKEETKVSEEIVSKEKKIIFQTLGSYLVVPTSGKMTVYSTCGRVVVNDQKVEKGMRIRLTNGIYYVHIHNENKKVIYKIVIVPGYKN